MEPRATGSHLVVAEARAQAEARALAEARGRALAVAWAQAGAAPQALVRARALAQAEALVKALAPVVAKRGGRMWETETWAEEAERTQAIAKEQTWAERWTEARAEAWKHTSQAHTFTYADALADSKLMDIIYSIISKPRSLARNLWPSPENWWLIQIIAPINRLPLELLQQILLIIIDNMSHSPVILMRVCENWYSVVTGIWAPLKLGTRTPNDAVTTTLEKNQRFLDVLVDTEIDRGHLISSKGVYRALFSAIKAISRWRTFVIETLPTQADLPGHLVDRGLQKCSGAVMSRLRTFKIKCPCDMSPLLERLLSILGDTASGELTTVTINSADVISFLVPTYSSIFRSVVVLSLHTPGLHTPVDLLPHLHQLDTFTASHLSLPVYHNDANLPLVHTLRHLTLRAVSIQWMSGRTFYALKSCTILFPLHHHALHTFSTTLPFCNDLTFQGYPLETLHGVSAHRLTHLSVTCSRSDKSRGNGQLVRFSSQALRASRIAPRILHISIEAMSYAWTKAFAFMSNLEELVIDNARPSSLGVKVLQSLVVLPVHVNNLRTAATSGGQYTPVCPSLKRFGLRYRRWLRPSEHFDLIPEFISTILSREQSGFYLKSFRIWTRSDQQGPLELIEGSGISFGGFSILADHGAIIGENLLQLVLSGLWKIWV